VENIRQIAYHFFLRKTITIQLYNISKVDSKNNKCQKTTSTHFAKQKLEQKQNSLHVKNFKVQKIHYNHIKTKIEKKTFKLPQKKTSNPLENGGDLKK
jgi:hypothetical protein